MSYQKCGVLGQTFSWVLASFLQDDGLPLAKVLQAEEIDEVMAAEGVSFGNRKNAVYTPALVLWGLLWHALATGPSRSYQAVVAQLRILCVRLSIRPPSPDKGAYWRACAKIPARAMQRLTLQVADQLETCVPRDGLPCTRPVKIVDGTTFTVPDTKANQAEWPQPASQESGIGFPIIRACAILSLATGAVCGCELGPYQGKKTGESALLRQMLDRFHRGDIVLADRYYASYWMIALLLARGVDVVFRQHQRRVTNFKHGRRLGHKDHVITWTKPARPEWMSEPMYQELPDTLTIRELDISVNIPGMRCRRITVVTTLLDAKRYPKASIAQLYRQRWHVELELRAIKIHMDMDKLRGESPPAVPQSR